jgi:hypothetical protein
MYVGCTDDVQPGSACRDRAYPPHCCCPSVFPTHQHAPGRCCCRCRANVLVDPTPSDWLLMMRNWTPACSGSLLAERVQQSPARKAEIADVILFCCTTPGVVGEGDRVQGSSRRRDDLQVFCANSILPLSEPQRVTVHPKHPVTPSFSFQPCHSSSSSSSSSRTVRHCCWLSLMQCRTCGRQCCCPSWWQPSQLATAP